MPAIPEPSQPILEFRNVWRSFGKKTVLAGINLAIHRGEVLVILGGSGTGKSVTLRQMNGLDHPDRGEVLLDGEDITKLSETELWRVRRRVGMLFQSGALFDSMTVFENVAFALREHTQMSEPEIARRVREVLGFVNLGAEVETLLPSSLSGGMKKRVSLARTIALQPEVLMYDEPTTGLDPVTSMTINRLIVDLNTRLSTTSIVVTHDITSALYVADRIAFLKHGQFVFTGTPAEAKTSSVSELRAFLEASDGEEEAVAPTLIPQERT
ncbi:MAG: ABC transporter ATP-binding protein [Thermoanaerobaculia bacterium]|nr:putative ribonucleotide transport ATP-binding protein mkl [Thermoanaerobaculia bacterium]MCK6685982.1 ABC transporter ATP-binding protein [Thermoanaerobaculia bacterium]